MLRFLRSRIGSSYEIKNENLDDFISYTKLAIHGFPQKVACFKVDDATKLLAIGTKDGRLLIYGQNGKQFCATLEDCLSIASINFMPGTNTLILLCNDTSKKGMQQLYRCQIIGDRLHFTPLRQEMHLKRITSCAVLPRNGDANTPLLIGTITGNIYALWSHNMELTEDLVFLDTSLIGVSELDTQQKSIDCICVDPEDPSKLFLLFNKSILILIVYDQIQDVVLKKIVPDSPINHIFLCPSSKKLFCAHRDGTYSTVDPMQNGEIEPIKPFGDVECTALGKIKAASSENPDEQFIIFTGGISEELDGRNTLSIFCSNRSLLLDFDSTILDFHIYQENEIALALFVLCEEELVAIDLQDPLWRMFPLPYLYPIHSSPITCITAASGLTAKAGILLSQIAHAQRKASKIYTKKWVAT